MTLLMLMNWLLSFTFVVEYNELTSHAQESSFVWKLWLESFLSKEVLQYCAVCFHARQANKGDISKPDLCCYSLT